MNWAWQPFDASAPQPEYAAITALATQSSAPSVCLLGQPQNSHVRGRYGFAAMPTSIQTLPTHTDAIAQAVDMRPSNTVRILLLGYEAGCSPLQLEPRIPPGDQPHGLILDCPNGLWIDHKRSRLCHLGDGLWPHGTPSQKEEMGKPTLQSDLRKTQSAAWLNCCDPQTHTKNILKIQEHISAGNIYQANLTQILNLSQHLFLQSPNAGAQLGIHLHQNNPVPHGAWIRLPGKTWGSPQSPDLEVVSNSMETLLTYSPKSNVLSSWPIKGTRANLQQAHHRASHPGLIADPKECSEHMMIVDLVRNDLGKVAKPGSVNVASLMHEESYVGVVHGVSKIEAQLQKTQNGNIKHATPGAALQALFPGGSITGAPKRRATTLLQEIENQSRGFYTGSIVAIFPNGEITASILIRTLVRDSRGFTLGVGGGILAESKPEREIQEMGEKIAVFQKALNALA